MLITIGVEALIILALLGALLVGQPLAGQSYREQITAQSTEISQWKATVTAYPTPTIHPCRTINNYYIYSC